MELHQIKDKSLWRILDRLHCKTEVLKLLKSFTQFDWSKEIVRLTREIGEIKMGLEPDELVIWNRIQKKKKENERISEKLMPSSDS